MDPDRALAQLAALQHGVVDRTDARAHGLTDDAIHRRLRAGRLAQAHPGVYVLPGAPDTWHQRLLAGCRAAGRAAVASHRSAASLWGLFDGEDVEVTVRRTKGPTPDDVVVHRSRDLLPVHITLRNGIPATNPLRTMVDLGAVSPDDVVAEALERGLVRKLFSVAALEWVLTDLAKPGRRGCGGLRRVLDDRALGAARPDSVLEARMARLLRSYGLPPARFHHTVPEARAEPRHRGRRVRDPRDGVGDVGRPRSAQPARGRRLVGAAVHVVPDRPAARHRRAAPLRCSGRIF